jgi:hypothetical protein
MGKKKKLFAGPMHWQKNVVRFYVSGIGLGSLPSNMLVHCGEMEWRKAGSNTVCHDPF